MEISLPAAAADMGVRLWLFHLEHESSRLPDYVAALHAKEVAVLKRIRCVHAATRYAACRWHLRKLLLSRYGRQTDDWRIGTHIFGKPFLEVPHGQSAPFLNFSHSGFCGCIALTFYTGMVGWSDLQGDSVFIGDAYHVASVHWTGVSDADHSLCLISQSDIFCADICGNKARIYAGAGVVAASSPQAELEETSAKFRTMLNALGLVTQGVGAQEAIV